MVMNINSKRETGRKAQLANIQAAKVIKPWINASCIFIYLFVASYIVGCSINRNFNFRASGYAQNAFRSNGRYRYDQRRVIKLIIFRNAILR